MAPVGAGSSCAATAARRRRACSNACQTLRRCTPELRLAGTPFLPAIAL